MERGRKRSDASSSLPADKRPCSTSEFRPGSSPPPLDAVAEADLSPRFSPSSGPASNGDMETSSSGHSDRASDSGYGSCESDDGGDENPARYIANRGRFERILSSLDSDGADPSLPAQLASLTDLCEALAFLMEDAGGYAPVERTVPALVKLAGHEGSPDVTLLAVRALTYLCDAVPRSAESIVRHGALPVLCCNLLQIEYLDVAEQCLQALEKVSKRQPIACLEAGTINAVLSYIDFFSTSIQRVAVSTVANLCKRIPSDYFSSVIESVPTLCNLLHHVDRKLVETVTTCLIRIVDSFSSSPELLNELCQKGLIQESLRLSVDGHAPLSQTTYTNLISLFTKLASSSAIAVKSLFELNIGSMLRGILISSDFSHGTSRSTLEDAQFNQVHEVLKLVNQLIPPAAKDVEDTQLVLAKEKILRDQPILLHEFSKDVLPIFIKAVNSGANLFVCYGCVSIINSIFYFSTPEMLLDLLKETNISSFVASLLSRKDHHVLVSTLHIVEILMQKLPDAFLSPFTKEGVVYAIENFSTQEKCSESTPQQSHDTQQADNKLSARDVSRCLCYAFNSRRSGSSETKPCCLGKNSLYAVARHVKTAYFNSESLSSEMGLSEILQKLKTRCVALDESVNKASSYNGRLQNEEHLSRLLDEVMSEFCGGETMTTFEFIESRIVRSFLNYLSNGRYLQEIPLGSNSSTHFLTVLKRFESFARISFSNMDHGWEKTPLTFLIRKLQIALSSFDSFPVVLTHAFKARNTIADIPFRHSTLRPCLRVCFVKEENEADLSKFDSVVNIEISTSFSAVEEYLWSRVSTNMDRHTEESPVKDDASGSGSAEERSPTEINIPLTQDLSTSSLSKDLAGQESQSLSAKDNSNPRALVSGEAPDNQCAQSKLIFSLKGKDLDRSFTIYQAIIQDQVKAEPDVILGPKFWNEVHTVTYRCTKNSEKMKPDTSESVVHESAGDDKTGFSWRKLPFFSSLLLAELPARLDKSNSSYDVLFMLKILEGLNQFSSHLLSDEKSNAFAEGKLSALDDLKAIISPVPQEEFISTKLTEKLEQQMRDPLVSGYFCMPLWCDELMVVFPFLFSFEARWKYFRLTTFGFLKTYQNSNDTAPDTERWSSSGSYPRKKFKVDRYSILESAAKMMELNARSKAPLEVEYNEEVGTGLGPTMEFYTLISSAFQKAGLHMWRGDLLCRAQIVEGGDVSGFVTAPLGLFPRPWSAATAMEDGVQFSEVTTKFALLGQLVAKAIKDGRILDMSLSRAFYKAIILEQELSIYDIQSFDQELGRTLLEFQALADRRRFMESVSSENFKGASELCYRGARLEDLCLDFTLPGYADYSLSPGNDMKSVTIVNLEEYISLVVDGTIGAGISRQVEAFKSGFNEVFPLKALKLFSEEELERLLCGEQGSWDYADLADHIKFDHGYTASSPPVVNLLEIIQEFDRDERRAFLQFITGAPRLPPGGLAALNPKLTVVRKQSSNDVNADLPSVMTCANYLKLPPYSSKERMRERLLYAITEGKGSFHLS